MTPVVEESVAKPVVKDHYRNLDQFFTRPEIAAKCVAEMAATAKLCDTTFFCEPAAGAGDFVETLNNVYGSRRVEAYDIHPRHPQTMEANFLEYNLTYDENQVVVGNPPFGARSRLAAEFVNKGLTISPTVAFIMPARFSKWSGQNMIEETASFLYSEMLPQDNFYFNGKPYKVRSVFQIWINQKHTDDDFVDLRLKKRLTISHPNFTMWQHDAIERTEKYFDYDWDFAVHRQGYKDYTQLFTKEDYVNNHIKRRTQYMFFKTDNPTALDRLKTTPFAEIGLLNTSTPGFGKAGIVQWHDKQYSAVADDTDGKSRELSF